MQYGICHLSIIPLRASADPATEMVSQLLYGEHFKVLEQRKLWSRIRIAFDGCEGWVHNDQITLIDQDAFDSIEISENSSCSSDLVSFVSTKKGILMPIVLGSTVHTSHLLGQTFEGNSNSTNLGKANLVRTALQYLNAPCMQGGRSPFGLDGAGLSQIIYKINGYNLFRRASEQAKQGTALSFIEESEAGDLAFFDTSDGVIDHVGIIMENNYIIHVNGKVRIDRLDHTGIFNTTIGKYTHPLRVIKKIL
jgi:hypothetical protein